MLEMKNKNLNTILATIISLVMAVMSWAPALAAEVEEPVFDEAQVEVGTMEDEPEVADPLTAGDEAQMDRESFHALQELAADSGSSEESVDGISDYMIRATYYNKMNAFINDPRWQNGLLFGYETNSKLADMPSQVIGCAAYACDFCKYVYGYDNYMLGDWYYDRNAIRTGDILEVNPDANGNATHAVVVLERNGDTLYTAEGNYAWHVRMTTAGYSVSGSAFVRGFHFADLVDSELEIPGSPLSYGTKVIPEGDYHIISACDPFMGLDIDGDKVPADNGSNVHLWHNLSYDQDVFTLKYDSAGLATLTQKGTGMAMEVDGGSVYPGANVQMWSNLNKKSQKWKIERSGDDKWYSIQSAASGYFLDLSGANTDQATSNVRMWMGNGSNAEKWRFVPCYESKPLEEGFYLITSAVDESKGWAVTNGSYRNLVLQGNVKDASKVFHLSYHSGDRSYSISHVATGSFLDVEHGVNGKNEGIYPGDGHRPAGSQQEWVIKEGYGKGFYNVISRANGQYVDLENASNSNGNNISLHWYNYLKKDMPAQNWKFTKLEELGITCGGANGKCEVDKSYICRYSSPGSENATWEISAGELPDGLRLDPATGTISGIPVKPGNFSFTLRISNFWDSAEHSFTIRVNDRPIVHVNGMNLNKERVSLSLKQSYDLVANITPSNAEDKSVKWTSSDPKVVTVSASGRLQAVSPGSATITATTCDGGLTDYCTVDVWKPLVITTQSLQDGTQDKAYIDFIRIEGSGSVTFRVVSGTLPDGLKILGWTGIIEGTPVKPGIYIFKVEAKSEYSSATKTYTISIREGEKRSESSSSVKDYETSSSEQQSKASSSSSVYDSTKASTSSSLRKATDDSSSRKAVDESSSRKARDGSSSDKDSDDSLSRKDSGGSSSDMEQSPEPADKEPMVLEGGEPVYRDYTPGQDTAMIKDGHLETSGAEEDTVTVLKGERFVIEGKYGSFMSTNKHVASVSDKGVVKAKKGQGSAIIKYRDLTEGSFHRVHVVVTTPGIYDSNDRLTYKLTATVMLSQKIDLATNIPLHADFEDSDDLEAEKGSDGRWHIVGYADDPGIYRIRFHCGRKRYTIRVRVRNFNIIRPDQI